MRFIDESNPYGDLARDMKDDHDLPESNERSVLDRYLDLERGACVDAMTTFHNAYDDYEIYLNQYALQ